MPLLEVRLAGAYAQTASVDYIVHRPFTGPDNDFIQTNGTLYFPPGVITQFVSAVVLDDFIYEGDEICSLWLSSPQNAVLNLGSSFPWVLADNEAPPVLSINDVAVIEGDAGTVRPPSNVQVCSRE